MKSSNDIWSISIHNSNNITQNFRLFHFSNIQNSTSSQFSVQIPNEVEVFYMNTSEKKKTQSFSMKF